MIAIVKQLGLPGFDAISIALKLASVVDSMAILIHLLIFFFISLMHIPLCLTVSLSIRLSIDLHVWYK